MNKIELEGKDKGGIIERRPTEVVSGLAIAGAVYGFLTQANVRTEVAAIIAILCGFGPLVVSNTVDAVRRER